MEDREFTETLLAEYERRGHFGHREHLHMAWSYVRRNGSAEAAEHVIAFVKHVAAHHGGSDKYNETMTRFWVYAMTAAVFGRERLEFDELLAAVPHLTDKRLPFRHWSEELLTSARAKAQWVEPDLLPLPG
jgi:hypothetical protein